MKDKNEFGFSNSAIFQIDGYYALPFKYWSVGDQVQLAPSNNPALRPKYLYIEGQPVLADPILFKNLTKNTSVGAYQIRYAFTETPGTNQILEIAPYVFFLLDNDTYWKIPVQSQIATMNWQPSNYIMMGLDPLRKYPFALNVSRANSALVQSFVP